MKKILHVMASPRGTASISRQLGDSITTQLAATNPGSVVTTVDLNVNPFPHLFEAQIDALRIPADRLTEAQKELTKRSDEAIAQVLEADSIVISLPLYNFGIPSPLKSWIDNIARAGYTFSYGADGPKGLVEGKKVYIALASGGVFSEGPFKEYDFAVPYLKTVLGFMGITDVEVIRAEGTAVSGLMEHALERAIERIAV